MGDANTFQPGQTTPGTEDPTPVTRKKDDEEETAVTKPVTLEEDTVGGDAPIAVVDGVRQPETATVDAAKVDDTHAQEVDESLHGADLYGANGSQKVTTPTTTTVTTEDAPAEHLQGEIDARSASTTPTTKAKPLGTDSELVTGYQDSASLGSGDAPGATTPAVPWAVTQGRAADLDTHNLVYYQHEGRTYLIPRGIVEDYEWQKGEYDKVSPEQVALAQQSSGSLYYPVKGDPKVLRKITEGWKPELDTSTGADVTDMTPEQREEYVQAQNAAITEQQRKMKVLDSLADKIKASEMGNRALNYDPDAPPTGRGPEWLHGKRLTEEERDLFSEAIVYGKDREADKTRRGVRAFASLVPGVDAAWSAHDSKQPDSPGGVLTTPEEARQENMALALLAAEAATLGVPLGKVGSGIVRSVKGVPKAVEKTVQKATQTAMNQKFVQEFVEGVAKETRIHDLYKTGKLTDPTVDAAKALQEAEMMGAWDALGTGQKVVKDVAVPDEQAFMDHFAATEHLRGARPRPRLSASSISDRRTWS